MKYSIILSLALTFSLISCASTLADINSDRSNIEIFDEFWTFVDEHYIYFKLKEVDWEEVGQRYRPEVTEEMSEEQLFDLCNKAMLELRDTHCRMESSFKTSQNYKISTGYEIHYSWDVIKDNYLIEEFTQDGNIKHSILDSKIGYLRINKMSKYNSLPRITREMKEKGVEGIIIDIRHNGGGDSNPVPDMIKYYTDKTTFIGSYIEKSGPGHQDVTAPIEMKVEPSDEFHFGLPITILTNRLSYSASSYFASMFGALDSVTLVGQVTGGGGGGNYSYQLSNGWIVAVSVSDYLDIDGSSIEPGVKPDVSIENTAEDIAQGRDRMLEKAMEVILL